MKLRFLWVGKTKRGPIKELVEDYLARVEKFARVEVVELRERDDAGGDVRKIIEKEGEEILAKTSGDQFVVVLDERGSALRSVELAQLIEKHRLASTRQMTFVIGGHAGLSSGVKGRADLTLALSRMTLTHDFARAVLAEQVYRAYTIIHDLPYQK
ncbi:MAG TPA: 23S rRNA (pseudouridine(1915)-N(3))-methyltransferase RlmH [Blastocatellia bacterium]|jgi:23S rRNA (pseudouridine1915-N3)-methyltransferase|nr:23S rRNA (pseudouridine(1915)-N(3))-methyltransferase RlmH [Blastocatellia bacterium]